jgi:hypothetical protein
MDESKSESSKSERKANTPRQRELIIAYLSYALDDIRALSEIGLHLLQLAIATINDDVVAEESEPPPPVVHYH